MRKLFSFTLVVCALILCGCTSEDKDLLRSLPDDVEVLVRIDTKKAIEQIGSKAMLEKLGTGVAPTGVDVTDMDDIGLDFSRSAYVFVTEKLQYGIIAAVRDFDKLHQFAVKNWNAVTENNGVYLVARTNMAFTKDRIMTLDGRGTTTSDLVAMLNKKELDNEDIIKQLSTIDEPIAAAIDMEIVKAAAAQNANLALGMSMMPVDLDDIYLLAGMKFTPGSMVLGTRLVAEDKEAEAELQRMKDGLTEIKDAKTPFVPNTYSFLFGTNLEGKKLKDYVPRSVIPFDTEDLLNALNGLLTISVGKVTANTDVPPFVLTAQANDAKCLDVLMEQMRIIGLPVEDQGRHTYVYDFGGNQKMLVGAQGGYVFMNFGNNMQRPEGNNTVNLEPGTVAYLNINFDNIASLAGKGMNQFTFWAQNDLSTHATLTLTNTWDELLEKNK